MLRKVLFLLASDFGPLLIFFVAFSFVDFIKATLFLITATGISTILNLFLEKRILWFPIIATIFTTAFGSLTVIFHNPDFIIFENTLYNALVGGMILILQSVGKDPLKRIFSDLFAISDKGWYITTRRWGYFMLASAVSNEILRIFFSPETWVYYRFWYLWILIGFAFWQYEISRRHRSEHANKWGVRVRH